jgi:hypothetical protein
VAKTPLINSFISFPFHHPPHPTPHIVSFVDCGALLLFSTPPPLHKHTYTMANIGWDTGRIHTAQVLPPQDDDAGLNTMNTIQEMFFAFIQQFHINGVYIYRYINTITKLLESEPKNKRRLNSRNSFPYFATQFNVE